MPIKCGKCGFENPSGMEYCGSCGSLFDGTEEQIPLERRHIVNSSHYGDGGRVSLLLYLGVALIALSGLLHASTVSSLHDGRLPPPFNDYAPAIGAIGLAFALVGLARQTKRMCE